MPRGGRRAGAGRKPKPLNGDSIHQVVQQIPDDSAVDAALATCPPDVTAHELMKSVYRAKDVPAQIRMLAAAKALPYEAPKPTSNKDAGGGGIVFKLGRHGAASD
jgi:hypothetical protein